MAYEYWFWTPLTCLGCGAEIAPQQAEPTASGLNPDLHDRWVHPGEVMPIAVDDFGAAFTHLRDPPAGAPLCVLVGWACPVSVESQWARLRFTVLPDGVRFDEGHSVLLTPEELSGAHFADNDVARIVRAMPPGSEQEALLAALS